MVDFVLLEEYSIVSEEVASVYTLEVVFVFE